MQVRPIGVSAFAFKIVKKRAAQLTLRSDPHDKTLRQKFSRCQSRIAFQPAQRPLIRVAENAILRHGIFAAEEEWSGHNQRSVEHCRRWKRPESAASAR